MKISINIQRLHKQIQKFKPIQKMLNSVRMADKDNKNSFPDPIF